MELRQSYKFTVKKLSAVQRFKKNKAGAGKARKAGKKIKTIAGRLVRELERKLTADSLNRYATDLSLFKTVLAQKEAIAVKFTAFMNPM
ncbi:MAG: hypothetical protein IPJ81_16545 [Chitinophagaceae bacterium]|nr:hypothetical protein [Chitinophagaceae bacterium]